MPVSTKFVLPKMPISTKFIENVIKVYKIASLFYVFQYITKQRGCANFDTAPLHVDLH